MMKVFCISKLFSARTPAPQGWDAPEIGEEVTVVGSIHIDDVVYFRLKEYPPTREYDRAYNAKAFAPLDGPDEREIIEERRREREERMAKVWKGIEKAINEPE